MKTSNLLKTLLPPVSYEPNGECLSVEIDVQATVLDAVELSAQQVADAVTPFSSGSLLADWERVYAVPVRAGATYQERLSNVLAKMAETGGVSVSYFIQLASSMGYRITIDELQPFRTGINRCGDTLYTEDIIWVWRVNVLDSNAELYQFRAGVSRTGERLLAFGDPQIETVFNDLKPAETLCIFAYPQPIDLSPIDLTSEVLDERLHYLCDSPHSCWGADGAIYSAKPNEWPVEYINGIAAGRHEPELEATNLVATDVSTWAKSNMSVSVVDDFYTVTVIVATDPFIQCDATVTPGQTVTNSVILKPRSTFVHRNVRRGQTGIAEEVGFNFQTGKITKSSAEIINAEMSTVNGLSQTISTYTTNSSLTQYQMRLMLSRPVHTVGDTGEIQYPQCEEGMIRTSPIITPGVKVRKKANALIRTQGAKGCEMEFNTGEIERLMFDGNLWIKLPHSSRHWGSRLISKIRYIS